MWSFSKLKNYETCPYRLVLAQSHKQGTNEFAQRGINIHKNIENFLNGIAEQPILPFFNEAIAKLKQDNAEAEVRWGLGYDWVPVPWNYASGKCVIDALVLYPDKLVIIDFKTGKSNAISHMDQAQTYAIAGNIYYPKMPIETQFWYLDSGKTKTMQFAQDKINRDRLVLEARIKRMETDKHLHPKPSPWVCKWCGHKEVCEYANV